MNKDKREVMDNCTLALWEFYNRCMDERDGNVSEEIMDEVMEKYGIQKYINGEN